MDDDGAIEAQAAFLAAILLLGLVLFASDLHVPPGNADSVPLQAERLAEDTLRVLAGTPAGGSTRLAVMITSALDGDGTDLSATLDRLLPAGVGWSLDVGNGVGTMEIARGGARVGPGATATDLWYPHWSYVWTAATQRDHAGASADDVLEVLVVPVRAGYLQDVATARLAFPANGHEVPLAVRPDGVALAYDVPPEAFAVAPDPGYPHAAEGAYDVTVTLPYPTQGTGAYRVVSGAVADPAVTSALRTTRLLPEATEVIVGTPLVVAYDHSTLPLPAGWPLVECRIRLLGPAEANLVAEEVVPCDGPSWTFPVPRSALLGTYVVDLTMTLDGPGALTQRLHDATVVHVVAREGAGHAPPVYRVSLTVWPNV